MRAWNGDYDAASRGALAFEAVSSHLARQLVPARRRAAYAAAWGAGALTWGDVVGAEPCRRQRALRRAVRKAAHAMGARETWGHRHRLRLCHALGFVPAIGRAWRFADLPLSGSNDTLMKTAHMLTDRRHNSRYGSVARQICDLSDLDRSYFVLLGGQDGWLGSTTFLDQLELWRRGEYVTLPLRPETARDLFPYRTDLSGAPILPSAKGSTHLGGGGLAPRPHPASPPPKRGRRGDLAG
jgi:penicillin amidase